MILFTLKCGADHEFEGWFRNSETYEAQAVAGEIACPVCGDAHVEKALMSPRLGRSTKGREVEPAPAPVPAKVESPAKEISAADITPAKMKEMLREIRKHVETNCDYVGPKFAEEARKIHKGEIEARGIYGEATPQESQALADDGIEVASIPWVPSSDA